MSTDLIGEDIRPGMMVRTDGSPAVLTVTAIYRDRGKATLVDGRGNSWGARPLEALEPVPLAELMERARRHLDRARRYLDAFERAGG